MRPLYFKSKTFHCIPKTNEQKQANKRLVTLDQAPSTTPPPTSFFPLAGWGGGAVYLFILRGDPRCLEWRGYDPNSGGWVEKRQVGACGFRINPITQGRRLTSRVPDPPLVIGLSSRQSRTSCFQMIYPCCFHSIEIPKLSFHCSEKDVMQFLNSFFLKIFNESTGGDGELRSGRWELVGFVLTPSLKVAGLTWVWVSKPRCRH